MGRAAADNQSSCLLQTQEKCPLKSQGVVPPRHPTPWTGVGRTKENKARKAEERTPL